MKNYTNFSRRGFAPYAIIIVIALALLGAGAVYYTKVSVRGWNPKQKEEVVQDNQPGGGAAQRETEPAVSTRAACEARCRDQYGGSGSAGFDACVRACGFDKLTASGSARSSGAALTACDFKRYGGVGCASGYKCFVGVDIPCGPGDACSQAIQVGDGLCHEACERDSDCTAGFVCARKTAFEGDVLMVNDNLCVAADSALDSGQPGGAVDAERKGSMTGAQTNPLYEGKRLAGTSAPLLDFTKADYDKAVASGKLVLLYFYANWCPICKAEFPKMQAAFDKLTTDKIVGFRVNYKDSETDADEEALARQFGVAYQHTKVFVKGGVVVSKHPDGWDEVRYAKEIEARLQMTNF